MARLLEINTTRAPTLTTDEVTAAAQFLGFTPDETIEVHLIATAAGTMLEIVTIPTATRS